MNENTILQINITLLNSEDINLLYSMSFDISTENQSLLTQLNSKH